MRRTAERPTPSTVAMSPSPSDEHGVPGPGHFRPARGSCCDSWTFCGEKVCVTRAGGRNFLPKPPVLLSLLQTSPPTPPAAPSRPRASTGLGPPPRHQGPPRTRSPTVLPPEPAHSRCSGGGDHVAPLGVNSPPPSSQEPGTPIPKFFPRLPRASSGRPARGPLNGKSIGGPGEWEPWEQRPGDGSHSFLAKAAFLLPGPKYLTSVVI